MVIINGIEENAAGKTIREYLSDAGYDLENVVVEKNLEIVQKSQWNTAKLNDGDTVEVLSFVGGG